MAATKKKATARKPARKQATKAAVERPARQRATGASAKPRTKPAAPAKKSAARKPAAKRSAQNAAEKKLAAKSVVKKPSAKKASTAPKTKAATAPKSRGAIASKSKRAESQLAKDTTAASDDAAFDSAIALEESRPTLEQVMAEIDAAEEAPLAERLATLDALEPRCWELEEEDRIEAQAALASAQQGCIDFAFTDADARAALLASVREAPYRTERVEMLAKLNDEGAYRLVREQAVAQLVTAYYKTRPSWLFALGGFAKHGAFADDARALLLGAFQQLVVHAQAHDELVNSVAFGALAFAAAGVAHPDTGQVLERAFAIAAGKTDAKAHYELNLVTGPLAIAMAALDHADAKDEIRAIVEEAERVYPGGDHVMQMRYALWMLEQDPRGAHAYLADAANTKNVGLAAAVIADLDYKAARETLAGRARTSESSVAAETMSEALQRLDKQQGPPAPAGRMIWMFGRKSQTEQALGSESDNVFVQRARARRKAAVEADD
jgi:hypothetical protein